MKSVWVVESGWFHEGGEVIAVTKGSIEAVIIKNELKRQTDYYDKSCQYIKISRWPLSGVAGWLMYEIDK